MEEPFGLSSTTVLLNTEKNSTNASQMLRRAYLKVLWNLVPVNAFRINYQN